MPKDRWTCLELLTHRAALTAEVSVGRLARLSQPKQQ